MKNQTTDTNYDELDEGIPSLRDETVQDEVGVDTRHRYRKTACITGKRGHATPSNLGASELRVDAGTGFISLWDSNVTLSWRFDEDSMNAFAKPSAAKSYFRSLLSAALDLWGTSVPVRFREVGERDAYDFEIRFNRTDDCDPRGCVLASAYFPDGGQHELVVYPQSLTQSSQERVETMAHELGHIFGLRHWFAAFEGRASEVFGSDLRFSIMNYGSEAFMTDADRSDLATLYEMARSGALKSVNGTPVRLIRPFSGGCQ